MGKRKLHNPVTGVSVAMLAICCFLVLFILDVMLFKVEWVRFTALYSFLLFPAFAVV